LNGSYKQKAYSVSDVATINLNDSYFLIPIRFVLASVAPLKGESK